MEKEKKIYVYADFLSFHNEMIGTIYVSQTRGKEIVKGNWQQLAQKYAVSRGEIERMIPAFKECDN